MTADLSTTMDIFNTGTKVVKDSVRKSRFCCTNAPMQHHTHVTIHCFIFARQAARCSPLDCSQTPTPSQLCSVLSRSIRALLFVGGCFSLERALLGDGSASAWVIMQTLTTALCLVTLALRLTE